MRPRTRGPGGSASVTPLASVWTESRSGLPVHSPTLTSTRQQPSASCDREARGRAARARVLCHRRRALAGCAGALDEAVADRIAVVVEGEDRARRPAATPSRSRRRESPLSRREMIHGLRKLRVDLAPAEASRTGVDAGRQRSAGARRSIASRVLDHQDRRSHGHGSPGVEELQQPLRPRGRDDERVTAATSDARVWAPVGCPRGPTPQEPVRGTSPRRPSGSDRPTPVARSISLQLRAARAR